MKKSLLILSSLLITIFSTAQKNTRQFKIGIGGTVGLPLGDVKDISNFAISGDIMAEYSINKKASANLSGGYLKFIAKNGFSTAAVIPVLVGSKVHVSEKMYSLAQVGVSFISNDGGTAFTYSIALGYDVSNNFDLALKYFSYSNGGDVSFVGLRAGISF